MYAEPASQRELTDGRERVRTRRRGGGPPVDSIQAASPGVTFTPERGIVLSATSRLLEIDSVAATMVAATINTRQAAGESGPAFVKRIVRAWLSEMARQS